MSQTLKERLAALAAKKRAEVVAATQSKSDAELFGVPDISTEEVAVSSEVEDGAKPVTHSMDAIPQTTSDIVPVQDNVPVTIESNAPKPAFASKVNLENAGEYFDLKLALRDLEEALEEQVEGFGDILFKIHSAIKEDPNSVTIFSDEEIGIFSRGLMRHTGITVSVTAPKSSKKTQKLSAAEL